MQEYRNRSPSARNIDTPATSLSNRNPLPPPPSDNREAWYDMDSQYGLTDMDIISREQSQATIEDEYSSYVTTPVNRAPVNLVSYWEVCSIALSFVSVLFSSAPQMAKSQHPTFFEMAMDYLPIQASAVPCERAFSAGAETLTARRNRIKPSLMEALQMLKFALKKRRLNFTEDLLTSEQVMDEKEDDDDPLQQLMESGTAGAVSDDIMPAFFEDEY